MNNIVKPTNPNISDYNPRRRQFLKFLLVGTGAFLLGWLSKSLDLLRLFSKTKEIKISSGLKSEIQPETDFGNWKIIKQNNHVVFIDKKTKEEVLILD